MKSLIFLSILIASSCGVEDEAGELENSPYPIQIESWYLMSSVEGLWVGIDGKMKNDTTFLQEPSGLELSIENVINEENGFKFILEEELLTTETNALMTGEWKMPVQPDGGPLFSQSEKSTDLTGGLYTFEVRANYLCSKNFDMGKEIIQLSIKDAENDTLHKVIRMNIAGVKEAVHYLLCF